VERIRSNNVIERLNCEIRLKTKVVRAFPDGQSALMLVCARLRYMESSIWRKRKYMSMIHLDEMDKISDIVSFKMSLLPDGLKCAKNY
jgi:transposase-like protein